MSDERYRVLILDDDIALGELLTEYLQNTGLCIVTCVNEESDFWNCLAQNTFDILFLDYKLPGTTGLAILERMGQLGVTIPTVMMTGEGSEHVAVRAIQSGALDYLVKGQYALSVLPSLIQKAVRQREMQREMQQYLEQVRYQAMLLNNVRDAVVVWDLDNVITYWNAAAEQLYGKTASEQIGRRITDVYLPLFNPPANLTDVTASGGVQLERCIRRPTGEQVWTSARVSTLYTGENPPNQSGTMLVARDITQRKLAEAKLQESEARYRAIVEDHQTEMICRFLPPGTLTFVNEAFCAAYQTSREYLLGTNFLALALEQDHTALTHQLAGLNLLQPVVQFGQRVQTKTGEIRWEEWIARAIFDQQHRLIEIQAVGRDITERKTLEEQVQAAQHHLTQAARLSAIGALASSVAHQISNPLTTIIAEAQMLSNSIKRDHPDAESVEAIEKAGWRAQSVINELMRFSQPVQAVQTLISVNETIESALLLTSAHIHSSGGILIVTLDDGLPFIRANAGQLTDLWVNLLLFTRASNASTADREINIRSRQEGRSKIVVQISNVGNIISPEEYDTIFEPKLIPAGSDRGTGMELSLCRAIAHQNGGQISVSGDGKETIFSIIFPIEGA